MPGRFRGVAQWQSRFPQGGLCRRFESGHRDQESTKEGVDVDDEAPDTEREEDRETHAPGWLDVMIAENGPHWAAYVAKHMDKLEDL